MRGALVPFSLALGLVGGACQLIVDEGSLVWEGARDASLPPGDPDAGDPDAGEPDAGDPDAGGLPDAGEPDAGEACKTPCEPPTRCIDMACVETPCLDDSECLRLGEVCHASGYPNRCGRPWRRISDGVAGGTLRAVWVDPDGAAWVVGDKANLSRCNAVDGCAQPGTGLPTDVDLLAVTGEGGVSWAAGTRGTVVRCATTCASWSTALSAADQLNAIALVAGVPWVATANGKILRLPTPSTSEVIYSGTRPLQAMAVANGEILAAGNGGAFVRCQPGKSPPCASSTLTDSLLHRFLGVASAGTHLWLVGRDTNDPVLEGIARHSSNGGLGWDAVAKTRVLRESVAGALAPDPTAWAVGGSVITRWTAAGWGDASLVGLTDDLHGVGSSADGVWVWAVGGKALTGDAVIHVR